MAQSPASLAGYLAFRGELVKGVLTPQIREQIALLVASVNDCSYCVAAHTFRGGKVGISDVELAATQHGHSANPTVDVALQFVKTLMEHRGLVSDGKFVDLMNAGWTIEEAGEIVAHVALNIFSNYFNHVAQPELDFPAPPKEP
jgi:AhpD family alkylhydroperoxidase